MRSMYTGKFFINAMKKKPHIRKVYEEMDKYSSEEIMEMMNIPKWFRDRLCELKDQGVVYSDDLDRQLIEGPDVQETTVHNPTGQVCQYTGEEWELTVTNEDSFITSIMMVEDGDWFFIIDPAAGEIRHKHSLFFTTQLNEIIIKATYLGDLTLTEYSAAYQAYVNARHGIVDDTIVDPSILAFLDKNSDRLTTAVSDIENNFPGVRINK